MFHCSMPIFVIIAIFEISRDEISSVYSEGSELTYLHGESSFSVFK